MMFALTLEPAGTVLPINAFPICSISFVRPVDGIRLLAYHRSSILEGHQYQYHTHISEMSR